MKKRINKRGLERLQHLRRLGRTLAEVQLELERACCDVIGIDPSRKFYIDRKRDYRVGDLTSAILSEQRRIGDVLATAGIQVKRRGNRTAMKARK